MSKCGPAISTSLSMTPDPHNLLEQRGKVGGNRFVRSATFEKHQTQSRMTPIKFLDSWVKERSFGAPKREQSTDFFSIGDEGRSPSMKQASRAIALANDNGHSRVHLPRKSG